MRDIKNKSPEVKEELYVSANDEGDQTNHKSKSLIADLKIENFAQGLVMLEILGRPRARRWRGSTVWNSRF